MVNELDEIKVFLSEAQARMDTLDERLKTAEAEAAQSQNALTAIDRRLSKSEKTLNAIGSIKVYKSFIQKDLKHLAKETKAIQSELSKVKRKANKNRSELKALAKVLRLQFQKHGIYLGKKASLKKICSLLACHPCVSPKLSKGGDVIEL